MKLQSKTILQKFWKAFNSWRKKGMWFRVTVLLIVGISMNFERLFTTDHIPLINELVWIACRAIRYGSEPKVTSAHLRYLHAQKSRQLQKQLFIEYKAGHIKLTTSQQKLLKQNTLNSNYNQLFELAKNKKLIDQDTTLAQSKRAMLDKACKLTADRYDHEYANIKNIIINAAYSGFSVNSINQNISYFLYSLCMVLPFPLTTTIPWLIICSTMGYCGACGKRNSYWIYATTGTILFTFLWIITASQTKSGWFKWNHLRLPSVCVFFIIWTIIACIYGKRIHKLAALKNKIYELLILGLTLSAIILLTPKIFSIDSSSIYARYWSSPYSWYWSFPGNFLIFVKSPGFNYYLLLPGIILLLFALLYILQIYKWKKKDKQ